MCTHKVTIFKFQVLCPVIPLAICIGNVMVQKFQFLKNDVNTDDNLFQLNLPLSIETNIRSNVPLSNHTSILAIKKCYIKYCLHVVVLTPPTLI